MLAVDIPSGVDGLTGEAGRGVLAADRTVTFAALKPGLLLGPGRILAGDVEVVDIGLDTRRARAQLVEAEDVAQWWRPRPPTAHKWIRAVRIVAGSPGMTGAAHLASAAAMRAGSGMVSLSTPGTDGSAPAEVVRRRLPAFDWSSQVLDDLHRYHALVVGPGLGREPYTVAAVRATAMAATVPLVVDGDGLFALAWDADGAAPVLHRRTSPTVLTPHDGEYGLLAGHRPAADRFMAARRLAADLRTVVLLKGPVTVVAAPGGDVLVVANGDARLATAGTGDVLSGILGAQLATGLDPFRAAATAAWLHAEAARLRPGQRASSPATSWRPSRGAGAVVSDAVAGQTGGRGPTSTSTPSPTTSACCARRPRRPACGPSSRPTPTGTAPSPSGRPPSTPAATGSASPSPPRGWRSARPGSRRRSSCSASSRPSTPRRSSPTG